MGDKEKVTPASGNMGKQKVGAKKEGMGQKIDYSKYYAFKQTDRPEVKKSLIDMLNICEDVRKKLNSELSNKNSLTVDVNNEIQGKLSDLEMLMLERMTNFIEIDNSLVHITKENELLRNQINYFENKQSEIPMRVKMEEVEMLTRKKIEEKKNTFSIIVESSNDKEIDVKRILRDEVKNTNAKFRIDDIVVTKDKKVILRSEEKKNLDTFGVWFNKCKKLKKNLKISEPLKRMERLILLGVSLDTEEDVIYEDLKIYVTSEEPQIKLIKSIKRTDSLVNWIIDVDAQTKEDLLKAQRVCIEFFRIRVVEYIRIIRCYKCQDFGHISTRCNRKEQCGKCGEEHDTRTCTNEIERCVNCKERNDHRADSFQCPSFVKYKKDKIAKRL